MGTLYQQGTQRIEVVIKKESVGVSGIKELDPENVSANTEDAGDGGSSTSKKMSDIRKRRLIKTNLTHGIAVMHQVGNLWLNNYAGGLGYKTGDKAYQDNIQRKMEVAQDGTNLATSVAMGVAYGSWGGPIGAAFGAMFGLMSSAGSIIFKYKGRDREYDTKVFKENNAVEYNRARAELNLTTGRLR